MTQPEPFTQPTTISGDTSGSAPIQLSLLSEGVDTSPSGRAFDELERLVSDLMLAHSIDDHLRALSNLVAMQPLIGLITSHKQELINADDTGRSDGHCGGGVYL